MKVSMSFSCSWLDILVIIDIQLCVGVSCASSFESDSDKVFTKDIVEHTVTKRAILGEDLIYNILLLLPLDLIAFLLTYPGIDLPFVLGHECGDVVLDDTGQGVGITDVRDPGWELGMPD